MVSNISHDLIYGEHAGFHDWESATYFSGSVKQNCSTLVNSWTRKMPQTSLPCYTAVSTTPAKTMLEVLPFRPPCGSTWSSRRIWWSQPRSRGTNHGVDSLQWEFLGLDPFVAVKCTDRLLRGLGQSISYSGYFHGIPTGDWKHTAIRYLSAWSPVTLYSSSSNLSQNISDCISLGTHHLARITY